jgi:AcrR family transcriptional regulator
MTDKKERILTTALHLFAAEGYANVPTSRIAKVAEVSEGLIFRHFGSKESLLDAILNEGIIKIESFAETVTQEKDFRMRIHKALDLPLLVIRGHKEFWKLQYTIKYQQPNLAKKYQDSDVFHALVQSIEVAFTELNYPNPKAETQLLMLVVTNLFTILLGEDQIVQEAFIQFLKSKY